MGRCHDVGISGNCGIDCPVFQDMLIDNGIDDALEIIDNEVPQLREYFVDEIIKDLDG